MAQTAPQFYCQLAPLGMPVADLARVRAACLLGARVTAGLLRGSGKPFACHLVGVASLVAESLPGDADAIVAALLHAMYQERVPFGPDRSARSGRLLEVAGAEVEALVARYEDAPPLGTTLAPVDTSDRLSVSVRILQLADELEDAVDGGPWWHGLPEDGPELRGSAEHRARRFLAYGPWYAQAPELGAPHLLTRWQAIRDSWIEGHWPVAFRSGERSTFAAAPL